MMSIYTTYIEDIYNDNINILLILWIFTMMSIHTTYIEDIYNDEYIY